MKRPFVRATLAVIVTVASSLYCAPDAIAQGGVTSSGTDFWLGFMPNGAGAGNSSVYEDLFIASGTDNMVTISGPVNFTFTMTAGQVHDIPLTDLMNSTDEVPQADALHVTSTNPITVYGYSSWANLQGIGDSPDGYLGLPLPAYGTEYYTVNFPDNFVFGNMPGEFLIISPYDNNVVTITPAAVTKAGKPANMPFAVTLQKGETYLVQSPGTSPGANDLTGSLIKSTKPVAVITGHQITSVPTEQSGSADNLLEMIPSVDKWGTQYFDVPMAGKVIAGDYLRVLSAENGNEIIYTGNASGQHGPVPLDSGQYFDITLQTEPMVLTSTNHKRFIVAQYSYSQGYDGDPGYSDPFLILFMPQEQFEKEMIFRTPSPLKGAFTNYVTFISLEDSISKITINGLPIGSYPSGGSAIFLGTTPQMGARRIIIAAQPQNYLAKGPVPFGAYQYGFSDHEGYGWPTGMAQSILSTGDTLPPLAFIVDSMCGSYHLVFWDSRSKANGNSFNDTHIASVSMITASGDLRWPTPSYNYTFTPDSSFIPGDNIMRAALTVNNPAQNAFAAIDAVDLAGNDTVFQYFYRAPNLTSVPTASFEFGSVLAGLDSCTRIFLTNAGTLPLFISSARMEGTVDSSIFTVSPATINQVLTPGDSISLDLCFTPSDTALFFDTLIVPLECASFHYPLGGFGVTPLIYATDLDFGEVDSGQTKCLPLTIRNPGKAPLTITAQDLVNDSNFTVDSNIFPITIMPGGSITIEYCFHPQSWGSFSRRVTFLNLNPTTFQHSIKDTSLLSGTAGNAGVNSASPNLPFALFISPNPTSGVATITLPQAGSTAPRVGSVEIFDVLGREVANFRVSGSYEWQMGALPAGTYIVRAEAGGAVVSSRVVKE